MLYNVSNVWEDGYGEDFIAFSKKGYSLDSKLIKSSFVKPFKYKITSHYPPGLLTLKNKKFITPNFIPCHPNTELDDIIWVKILNKIKIDEEIKTWRFKSSSSDSEYVTRKKGLKYTCNCSGFWRVKDKEKGCKHIQEVKQEIENKNLVS
jgi:hypothetical protein